MYNGFTPPILERFVHIPNKDISLLKRDASSMVDLKKIKEQWLRRFCLIVRDKGITNPFQMQSHFSPSCERGRKRFAVCHVVMAMPSPFEKSMLQAFLSPPVEEAGRRLPGLRAETDKGTDNALKHSSLVSPCALLLTRTR